MIELIRVGQVVSVDAGACTARVHFDDLGMVSAALPVLQPAAGPRAAYILPNVGDQVLCAFLGNGEEQGFVVGSLYSDSDAPPESGADSWYIEFAGGGGLKYVGASSELTIDANGGVEITAGLVTINGNLRVEGQITASGIIQGNVP